MLDACTQTRAPTRAGAPLKMVGGASATSALPATSSPDKKSWMPVLGPFAKVISPEETRQ